jgi:hypothetical protein
MELGLEMAASESCRLSGNTLAHKPKFKTLKSDEVEGPGKF